MQQQSLTDYERCWQAYHNSPGLTCAAIGHKLGIPTIEVQRHLGYLPRRGNTPPSVQSQPAVELPPKKCSSCGSKRFRDFALQQGKTRLRCCACWRELESA